MTDKPEDAAVSPSLRPGLGASEQMLLDLGPMPSGFAPCGCRQYWDEARRTVVAACELRCAAEKCTRRVRRRKKA